MIDWAAVSGMVADLANRVYRLAMAVEAMASGATMGLKAVKRRPAS